MTPALDATPYPQLRAAATNYAEDFMDRQVDAVVQRYHHTSTGPCEFDYETEHWQALEGEEFRVVRKVLWFIADGAAHAHRLNPNMSGIHRTLQAIKDSHARCKLPVDSELTAEPDRQAKNDFKQMRGGRIYTDSEHRFIGGYGRIYGVQMALGRVALKEPYFVLDVMGAVGRRLLMTAFPDSLG